MLAGSVNCNAPAETEQFAFVPLKGVESGSSRSANTCWLSIKSGKSNITEVSPILKFPWSSLNFKIYSPSRLGTTASVVLPASASIKSTEF